MWGYALTDVKTPREIPVRRLPVYARAESDLYHWAGKLMVPRGQVITPELVAALVDTEVESLYTNSARNAHSDRLEEIDIASIQEDVRLPFTVFDRQGRLLAHEGDRLSRRQVDSLHRRGQRKLYYSSQPRPGKAARFEANFVARIRTRLDDETLFTRKYQRRRTGISINRFTRVFSGRARRGPIVMAAQRFWNRTVGTLEKLWARLVAPGYVRNRELVPLANEILDRYIADRELMAAAAFSQPNLPPYSEHCLATAIYSLFVAQRLDYNRAQSRDLIIAALFHDVGYKLIPSRLLTAERQLTKGERRIIFRHIEHGLLLTQRIDWPGELWRLAIYQHQERGTGAGYPSGFTAEHIHEYAKVLAAADVLHALVSDRPHRKAYSGGKAMTMLMKMAAMGLLDKSIVRTLARELGLYPVGSTVKLSTGELVRVIAASREPLEPWVGEILSASGLRPKSPRIIDLSRFAAISIAEEAAPFEEPFAGF